MRYYDEGQQFSDAFIPASVRHLFVQCDFHHPIIFPMRRRPQHPFPLYFDGRNIHSLAVQDLVAVSLEESNDEQFTQVSSLAYLETLSREAEVVGLLRVVKWCPGLQRLGFVVNAMAHGARAYGTARTMHHASDILQLLCWVSRQWTVFMFWILLNLSLAPCSSYSCAWKRSCQPTFTFSRSRRHSKSKRTMQACGCSCKTMVYILGQTIQILGQGGEGHMWTCSHRLWRGVFGRSLCSSKTRWAYTG